MTGSLLSNLVNQPRNTPITNTQRHSIAYKMIRVHIMLCIFYHKLVMIFITHAKASRVCLIPCSWRQQADNRLSECASSFRRGVTHCWLDLKPLFFCHLSITATSVNATQSQLNYEHCLLRQKWDNGRRHDSKRHVITTSILVSKIAKNKE